METSCRYDIEGFANGLGFSIEDISDLFSEFIKELDSEVIKLKEAADKKDWTIVKGIIHNIKGVSGNYRITDVYTEASIINNNLKADNYDDIESIICNFCSLSEAASSEIKRYFSELGISL